MDSAGGIKARRENGIEEGKKRAQYVIGGFQSVQSQSVKVTDIIKQIISAGNEQSLGVNQINLSMSDMEKIVQQNLAMSLQTNALGEKMLQQADALHQITAQLMRIIKGEDPSSAQGPQSSEAIALVRRGEDENNWS